MTKNIIIISPDSQSSVTLGFTQVLTGTCHLLSPLTSPAEGQLGYNQEQSTDTHTHTRGEQRVKKKKPTAARVHDHPVHTRLSVVTELVLGHQVAGVEGAGLQLTGQFGVILGSIIYETLHVIPKLNLNIIEFHHF